MTEHFVITKPQDLQDTLKQVKELGGKVLETVEESGCLVQLPQNVPVSKLTHAAPHVTEDISRALNSVALESLKRAQDVWVRGQSKLVRTPLRTDGLPWGAEGYGPPGAPSWGNPSGKVVF